MIRTIEALIERRKKLQDQLNSNLNELAEHSRAPFWRRRRQREKLQSLYRRLGQTVSELITVSDQEWDAQSNNHSGQVFAALQHQMETLQAQYQQISTLLVGFAQLEEKLSRLIAGLDQAAEQTRIKTELQAIREQLSPFQYADFEQRFRGGQQAVQDQLGRYLPLLTGHAPVLDLGCGRGEFVAMLLQAGIAAEGIDLSHSMLRQAQTAGLPCRHGDIVATLEQCPSDSLGALFSAQVIEHLDGDSLRRLVSESFRVLKPGGLLLLETVNPLSLFAFSRIFLLDTTHRSALHPEFMRYLLQCSAFTDVEIVYGPLPDSERLGLVPAQTPESAILNQNTDKLNRLLFGASVYAVKGTKP